MAILVDNNQTLSDTDLRNPYDKSASFSGEYHTLHFFYATVSPLGKYGSHIMVVGENPYSISVGPVPFILVIMAGLLLIYSVATCIRCCFSRSSSARGLVEEYERREWEKSAPKRMQDILKDCPPENFTEGASNNKYTEKSCAVCLGEFKSDATIRRLTCSHIFHAKCIESWIQMKINEVPKCPVCNSELTDQKPPGEDLLQMRDLDLSFND